MIGVVFRDQVLNEPGANEGCAPSCHVADIQCDDISPYFAATCEDSSALASGKIAPDDVLFDQAPGRFKIDIDPSALAYVDASCRIPLDDAATKGRTRTADPYAAALAGTFSVPQRESRDQGAVSLAVDGEYARAAGPINDGRLGSVHGQER